MIRKVWAVITGGVCLGIGFGLGAASSDLKDPSTEFTLNVNISDSPDVATSYVLKWDNQFEFMVVDGNRDGIVDSWWFSQNGDEVFKVKDRNHDQRLDYWWKRTEDRKGVLAVDEDYDGVVDAVNATVTVTKY